MIRECSKERSKLESELKCSESRKRADEGVQEQWKMPAARVHEEAEDGMEMVPGRAAGRLS